MPDVEVAIVLNGVSVPVVLDEEAIAAIAAALPDRAEGAPEWMSVTRAAAYLDVSPERLRKLQSRKALAYYQEDVGHRVLFRRVDLDAYMADHRHEARGDGAA